MCTDVWVDAEHVPADLAPVARSDSPIRMFALSLCKHRLDVCCKILTTARASLCKFSASMSMSMQPNKSLYHSIFSHSHSSCLLKVCFNICQIPFVGLNFSQFVVVVLA